MQEWEADRIISFTRDKNILYVLNSRKKDKRLVHFRKILTFYGSDDDAGLHLVA